MGAPTLLKQELPTAPAAPDFRELFESQFSYVWNVLRRLSVPERDLEDLTQQVFLQVYGQWSKYERDRPLRPWLFSFAYPSSQGG